MSFDPMSLETFEENYKDEWESEAHGQRGAFLRMFPRATLPRLSLHKYVIGKGDRTSFCYMVEFGTKTWALVSGSSADKFGIYHGKTAARYLYSKKFAKGLPLQGYEREVFRSIRGILVDLLSAGENGDFAAIDTNPLSQMFKAKILSLYFPDQYMNVCDGTYLRDFAKKLSIDSTSESTIQAELLRVKQSNQITQSWTQLKFMAYLFRVVLGVEPGNASPVAPNKKIKKGEKPEVDFEKLQKRGAELGRMSEKFALKFEGDRLLSEGLSEFVDRIKDRTKRPGYGYDFQSWSTTKVQRYVEVKTFTRGCFYLPVNEHRVSISADHTSEYYFYLVEYGSDGKPTSVLVRKAADLYKDAALNPYLYLVTVS